MFERFTDRSRRILVVAQEQAREMGHNYLGTEHLLLALAWEEDTIPYTALTSFTTYDKIKEAVEQTLGPVPTGNMPGTAPFTRKAKKVLEYALREALQLGHNYIGPEHMLLGIMREDMISQASTATVVLAQVGVNLLALRSATISMIGRSMIDPGTAWTKEVTLTLSWGEKVEILDWLERFSRTLDHQKLPYPLDGFNDKLREA